MTRQRLRPLPSPDELAAMYAVPHDHTRWEDHLVRVGATIEVGRQLLGGPVESGADLSCGSGAVLLGLPVTTRYLGDLAPGYPITGPIEETIEAIPHVDVFVNTETAEHVDDPPLMLKAIRAKARLLLLSTPVDNWDDQNAEHLWAWSRTDVEVMLADAGWTVADYVELDFRFLGPGSYKFGIWGAR